MKSLKLLSEFGNESQKSLLIEIPSNFKHDLHPKEDGAINIESLIEMLHYMDIKPMNPSSTKREVLK